jgi:hypothetical protein
MTIAASPGQLVIEPDQQFILTNNGTEPWSATWNRRKYTVPPGQHIVVPFDIIRVNFGDPRSVVGVQQKYEDADGNRGDINKREKEIERLAVLLGLYAGNESKIPDHPKVKHMKIETIDRQEIFCPAVDPDGMISYAHREATDNVQDTASLLAQMQRRLDQQQKLIDILAGVESKEDGPDDELGIDRPRFPE